MLDGGVVRICVTPIRYLTAHHGYNTLNTWLFEAFHGADEAVQASVLKCLARLPLTAQILEASHVRDGSDDASLNGQT